MADVNFTEQEGFADFEPALSIDDVERLEESAKTQARGQRRRCVFAACSASSDKLRELRDEAPEAFLEMLEAIQAFNEHAKGLSEIAESALARMLLAGTTEAAH